MQTASKGLVEQTKRLYEIGLVNVFRTASNLYDRTRSSFKKENFNERIGIQRNVDAYAIDAQSILQTLEGLEGFLAPDAHRYLLEHARKAHARFHNYSPSERINPDVLESLIAINLVFQHISEDEQINLEKIKESVEERYNAVTTQIMDSIRRQKTYVF